VKPRLYRDTSQPFMVRRVSRGGTWEEDWTEKYPWVLQLRVRPKPGGLRFKTWKAAIQWLERNHHGQAGGVRGVPEGHQAGSR
jgi:hypothetical protein